MEKDEKLGSVGELKASFSGGVGRVEIAAAVPGMPSMQGGAFVQGDSGAVMDMLFALIEKNSPAGLVAIEESAKALIKAEVAKL